jgi:uncharacterized repeat protein (TIGR01451 family)
MRRGPLGGAWRLSLLTALLAGLALPSLASAIGISLDRSPAPPQAIQRGVGTETFNFTITYQTIADSWTMRVTDPSGVVQQPTGASVAGQPSPINGTGQFSPSAGAPLGRYRSTVDFFSTPASLESSAFVTFDVADQLGTLQLVKYEDVNGNGNREPGEPGVPGWVFRLTNPQGNPSVTSTGADGSATIPGVPAGTWQVAEVVDPAWAAITPSSGQVSVPANGVGSFVAGNARPAAVSGFVFVDADGDGIRDAGEEGRTGVKLTLTGSRPGGITVAAQSVLSGNDGAYSFPGLLPGSYTVSMAVPGGLTATTARVISGIGVTSGTGSPNNNFGLAGPGVTTAGGPSGPRPDLRIGKAGPPTARAGSTFTYTIVVRNRSEFTATNVEVTDLVPASLTLVAIPSGATIRNGVVTWRVGSLRAGRRRTLRMQVRVNPNVTGRIRNTATVTADGLPPKRARTTTRVTGPRPVARTGGVTG